MVERYLIIYDERGETLHPSGDFVHYQDYTALERQIAELRAKWNEALGEVERQAERRIKAIERAEALAAENARLRALPLKDEVERVLDWYAEQTRLCRLIHSGGDAGRNALAQDGGKQASTLLSRLRAGEQEGWRTQAADDVLAERKRQIEAEGWTPEHDDSHKSGELAIAAACYALNATDDADGPEIRFVGAELWPWADEWWKPGNDRRNLVKAGALILAEIERLDRFAAAPSEQGGDRG